MIFFQFFSPDGLVNHTLATVLHRRIVIPWLTSPAMVLPSVLIASLWLATGYGMIYFLAALQAVDRELYEAAAVDGAGPWNQFFHITLPGIRHVLLYMLLIGVIGGFQLFELPFVLSRAPAPMAAVSPSSCTSSSLDSTPAISATPPPSAGLLVAILLIIFLARFRFFRFRQVLGS